MSLANATPLSQSTRAVIPGVQRAGTLKQQPPPPPWNGPIMSMPDWPLTLKWLIAHFVWLMASMVPPPPPACAAGCAQPVNSSSPASSGLINADFIGLSLSV